MGGKQGWVNEAHLTGALGHVDNIDNSVWLWPILIPQFVAGWFQGWLRFRSDSILPSWFCHSLSNTLSALAFI
jgi:membrane protease YdiL (CAAX protease family)